MKGLTIYHFAVTMEIYKQHKIYNMIKYVSFAFPNEGSYTLGKVK